MSKNIYVGNLSFQVTSDDLQGLFAPFGDVNSAQVVMDWYGGYYTPVESDEFEREKKEKLNNFRKALAGGSWREFPGSCASSRRFPATNRRMNRRTTRTRPSSSRSCVDDGHIWPPVTQERSGSDESERAVLDNDSHGVAIGEASLE